MTSIWFPNNKYPPNTKNYLPCFVLGGGLVLGGRDYSHYCCIYLSVSSRSKSPQNIWNPVSVDVHPVHGAGAVPVYHRKVFEMRQDETLRLGKVERAAPKYRCHRFTYPAGKETMVFFEQHEDS